MSRAFLFSGQGSQYVGMGLDLIERDREWFDSVEQQLQFDLEQLLREGPEEKLERTRYTQPAIFVVNHLLYRFLDENGIEADVFAGHSLGELNAYVGAGWVEFEQMLPVVVRRGEAMDEAAREAEGGMAAVLKMDPDELEQLTEEISDDQSVRGTVEIGLMNTPGQMVVSGSDEAIEAVTERARDRGALKAVSLDVSGPWHSQYMEPARDRLREVLESVDWDRGKTVYSNVTAGPVESSDQARQGLLDQLIKPVRWYEIIREMEQDSVDEFIELGPGEVVEGMVSRIVDSDGVTVRSTDSIEHTRSWLEGVT